MSDRRSPRDEHGFTLVELVVSLALGMIMILGILTVTEVAMRNSARTATASPPSGRGAGARATDRPAPLDLHRAGGRTAACREHRELAQLPAPDGQQRDPAARQDRGLALEQHLSQSVFPSTGGEAPNWTFAGTPSSTRVLLTGVGPARTGSRRSRRAPVSVLQVRRRRRRPHLAPDPAQRRQLGARGAGRRRYPSPLSNPTNDARGADHGQRLGPGPLLARERGPDEVNGPCV